jgi:hypothetical protein
LSPRQERGPKRQLITRCLGGTKRWLTSMDRGPVGKGVEAEVFYRGAISAGLAPVG